MHQQCLSCNARIKVTKDNTKLHLFSSQPWFSWIALKCTCKHESHIFLWPAYDEYIAALPVGVPVISEKFAPDSLVAQWEEVFDRHPLAPKFVSERQLRLVAFLAWLLANRETEINP